MRKRAGVAALELSRFRRSEGGVAVVWAICPIKKEGFPRAPVWAWRIGIDSLESGSSDVELIQITWSHSMSASLYFGRLLRMLAVIPKWLETPRP